MRKKKCIVFSNISYYFFDKSIPALASHMECCIYTTYVFFNMILTYHPNKLKGLYIINDPQSAHENHMLFKIC